MIAGENGILGSGRVVAIRMEHSKALSELQESRTVLQERNEKFLDLTNAEMTRARKTTSTRSPFDA